MPLQRSEVTIGGVAIKYLRAGSGGKTIVCIAGLGASSRYFVPLITELARTHTVYSPDQPDSGRSQNTDKTLSVSSLAKFYAQFINELSLTDYVLVANSMGCQIAVELVTKYPTSAQALVLTGPTINPHERSAVKQIGRWLQDGLHEPVRGAKILVRDIKDTGLPRFIRTLRHALKDRIEEKLPLVRQPVLIIRGENDPICPQNWAEEATSLLPSGRLEVIKDTGHAAHYSNPEETAALINSFLT